MMGISFHHCMKLRRGRGEGEGGERGKDVVQKEEREVWKKKGRGKEGDMEGCRRKKEGKRKGYSEQKSEKCESKKGVKKLGSRK